MSKAKSNFEIERKFLIDNIDEEELRIHVGERLKKCRIEQVYLVATEGERRIRRCQFGDVVDLFYTEKISINGLKRIERESEICEHDYSCYLKEADPNLKPINKIRYSFDFCNQIIEIDVYDFCSDYAVLEIEIPDENTPVKLPYFITLIKDVTYDKAYKNHELAKSQRLSI